MSQSRSASQSQDQPDRQAGDLVANSTDLFAGGVVNTVQQGQGAAAFSSARSSEAGQHKVAHPLSIAPPTIYKGDFARAIRALEPGDNDTRAAIAAVLGLEWQQVQAPAQQVAPDAQPTLATRANRQSVVVEPSKPAVPTLGTWIESTISEAKEAESKEPPTWLERKEYTTLDTDPEGAATVHNRPPLEPLFVPTWTRGILSIALSTNGGDGELDVARVVDDLARGVPLRQLYRLPAPTLRRGVQLLVDKSAALEPFFYDQDYIVREIERVTGTEKLRLLSFSGLPTRQVHTEARDVAPDAEANAEPYTPPRPGTVVVLLTDLGIGRTLLGSDSAGATEWAAFARLLRQASCPCVALVPYKPDRWPPGLAGLMTILFWDRRTGAGAVLHLIGLAHEVRH